MQRLKIYFMHSEKFDYNNIIYKKVLSSNICLNHELILPLSSQYKEKYAKELIKSADLVVVFLNYPSFGFNIELYWLRKFNKKCLFLSIDNVLNKYKKKYDVKIVNSDNFIEIVENFINENQKEEKYADINVLGNIS